MTAAFVAASVTATPAAAAPADANRASAAILLLLWLLLQVCCSRSSFSVADASVVTAPVAATPSVTVMM